MSQMISPHQFSSVRPNGTLRVSTVNDEPSLTQQQFAADCDVNNIMKKYADTGQLTHLANRTGIFSDFTQITDYHGMVQLVQYADQAFNSLPAEMRKRFDNDPGKLLEFIQDTNNYEEALKLGLVNARPSVAASNDDDLNDNDKAALRNSSVKGTKKPSPPPSPQSSTPPKEE